MLAPLAVDFKYGIWTSKSILSTFFEDRNISANWTGLIFAAYAIASTFSSLISGKCLDKIGHRTLLICGTLQMSASIVSFGLIYQIESDKRLIAVAVLLRIVQGNLKMIDFATVDNDLNSFLQARHLA